MFGTSVSALLDRKYAIMEEENRIRARAANALAGLQGAQAQEVGVRTGLLPSTVASENAFRGANTDAVRLGLGFIAPRAQAEIGQINANTAFTNQRTVTERAQPRLMSSQIRLNDSNTLLNRNTGADSGVLRDDFYSQIGLSGLLGPRRQQTTFGGGFLR